MCGRFALKATTKDIEKLKPGIKFNSEVISNLNISPTNYISIITNENDELQLTSAHWGLIPSWAKEQSMGAKLFNARAETIDEKPSFRSSFKKRRCIVPASYFYEWKKDEESGKKQPYKIKLINNDIFYFAGLFEYWKSNNSDVLVSATIITTEPNSLMSKIHNRMPVILDENGINLWLDNHSINDTLKKILIPCNSDLMQAEEIESDFFKRKKSELTERLL